MKKIIYTFLSCITAAALAISAVPVSAAGSNTSLSAAAASDGTEAQSAALNTVSDEDTAETSELSVSETAVSGSASDVSGADSTTASGSDSASNLSGSSETAVSDSASDVSGADSTTASGSDSAAAVSDTSSELSEVTEDSDSDPDLFEITSDSDTADSASEAADDAAAASEAEITDIIVIDELPAITEAYPEMISKENTPNAYLAALLLVEKGLSIPAACGIVGNFFCESGGQGSDDIKPNVDNGNAAGIAQWTGESRTAFMNYCERAGKAWNDLDTQLEYLLYNLEPRWAYARQYGSVKALNADEYNEVLYYYNDFIKCDDVMTAAISFLGVYEDDLYLSTALAVGFSTLSEWVNYEVFNRVTCAYACYREFFGGEIDYDRGITHTFAWGPDYKTAAYSFKYYDERIEAKEAAVTTQVISEGSCTKKSVVRYTASLSYQGNNYSKSIDAESSYVHNFVNGFCTICGAGCFSDVPKGAYYYDAVYKALSKGITTGTTPTTFSPDVGCSRAQFVTFLWRLADKPEPGITENPFEDVGSDMYYYTAVLWAYEKGITTGTSERIFSPDLICLREQVVTFLYRYKESPEVSDIQVLFTDIDENAYYYPAVLWAFDSGITTGTSQTEFSPNFFCLREQAVTFLFRLT